MSHEIRTPMNGVLDMVDLLLGDPRLETGQRSQLATIRSSAEMLLGILNDILDLSKLEAGKLMLVPAPFHVQPMIWSVADLLRPNAIARGLELRVEFHPDLPEPSWRQGDAARLRQILFNLAGNAIKFTGQGSVTLRVAPAGGNQLRFEVEDTGCGILPEDQARIFEKFEQAGAAAGGTGLGLAITRSLVKEMGGRIGLRSKPGEGSCFFVLIPLPQAEAPAAVAISHDGQIKAIAPGLPVLVVEDNLVNQRVARGLLESLGCSVTIAGSGEAALDLCRQGAFPLVLMDCQMPGMDGLDATRAIRSLPGHGIRPSIVALTANAFPEDRLRCLEAGMDDYLSKPIQIAELARVVGQAGVKSRVEDTEGSKAAG
jgi:CheY-like chemotaxis protein